MVDVVTAVARFSTPTSTGSQDWTTTDLGGITPKAAIIFASHATTDGTAIANSIFGCYFAQADFQGLSSNDTDALGSSSCSGESDSDSMEIRGTASVAHVATFTTFISDGIRLNFTTTEGTARLFTVIFFGGADLSAKGGTATLGLEDIEVDVTGVGFQPDLVFLASTGDNLDGNVTHARTLFGAGNATAQLTSNMLAKGGQATSRIGGIVRSDRAGGITFDNVDFYSILLSNIDSDGFSLTAKGGDGGSTHLVHYLALNVGGLSTWVGALDSPIATGNAVNTSPAFQPQLAILGMTMLQSYDTHSDIGDGASLGYSAFTPTAEFSNAWASEDGVGATNTQSLSDDQAVNFTDDAGAQTFAASFSSMDSLGFTLNYTVADGTARKWFGIAIQDPADPALAAQALAYSMIHMMISQPQQAPATAVASGFAWAQNE